MWPPSPVMLASRRRARSGSARMSRLEAGRDSREVLGRLERLVSRLPMPDRLEHHYPL